MSNNAPLYIELAFSWSFIKANEDKSGDGLSFTWKIIVLVKILLISYVDTANI